MIILKPEEEIQGMEDSSVRNRRWSHWAGYFGFPEYLRYCFSFLLCFKLIFIVTDARDKDFPWFDDLDSMWSQNPNLIINASTSAQGQNYSDRAANLLGIKLPAAAASAAPVQPTMTPPAPSVIPTIGSLPLGWDMGNTTGINSQHHTSTCQTFTCNR